jgi:hypothetical protein
LRLFIASDSLSEVSPVKSTTSFWAMAEFIGAMLGALPLPC